MHYISELVQQLRRQLLLIDCAIPGRKQIVLPLPLEQKDSLLVWLDNQSVFPAFYWCNRSNTEEVVACGAIITFKDIVYASRFVNEAPQSTMRIWGLNAFDQLSELTDGKEKGFLFLPRLEIARTADGATITLNLYSESSLKADAQSAVKLLDKLTFTPSREQQDIEVISVIHQPEKGEWIALLHKALDAIEQKEFDKVVMARKTTLTLKQTLNPVQFINNSKAVNYNCFHIMMRFNEQRAFLGSSPERLFYREDDRLTTEALAGTVANSTDENESQRLADWLMNDGKNLRENRLVVDDICQRLKPFVKKIDIQPVEIVKLRKVQHLRHKIHVQLDYISDVDCLYWLQPTAAVAGLPRKPALDFILENEPFDREWYAGSAGYVSYKQSEFSVTLRSALIDNNKISLYAGAGIITDSDPLYEWLEIENKAAGLRTLLTEE